GFLALLGHRHGRRSELTAEALLVPRLEHARLAEQRAHRVGGLRAAVEPVVHAIGLEVQRLLARTRSVLPDDLDELAVARAARVGDDDAVHGLLLATRTTQANLDGHYDFLIGVLVLLRAPRGSAICRSHPDFTVERLSD